jgi:hypothetical protein
VSEDFFLLNDKREKKRKWWKKERISQAKQTIKLVKKLSETLDGHSLLRMFEF